VAGATASLAESEQSVRQNNYVHRMPDVAAAQVVAFLRQGDVAAAARLAETHQLPMSRARVLLAQGDASAASAVLEPYRRQMEARGWADERLKAMILQAVALHANGEEDEAVQQLSDALALADTGGFVRTFVDEGVPMARLLSAAAGRGVMPGYTGKLLAAFAAEADRSQDGSRSPAATPPQPLEEPLSQRELEVLRLIAQGLSNQEICERLFLALSTVKGHNWIIFDKLQVHRRTEAVARARELGLL
jgi:LuxR family maltose regulon positive regulatory protein